MLWLFHKADIKKKSNNLCEKVPEKYKTKSRQKVLLVINRYYPIKYRVKYTEKLITAFLPEKKWFDLFFL